MSLQFFFFMCFFISMNFNFLYHMLFIGVFSLILVLLLCLLLSVYCSVWFGAVSMLVFVGGLLVMFAYFLSIIPNYINLGPSFLTLISYCAISSLLLSSVIGAGAEGAVGQSSPMDISSIYSLSNSWLLYFFAGVLLVNLFSVVNIVSLSSGPLRPFTPLGNNT